MIDNTNRKPIADYPVYVNVRIVLPWEEIDHIRKFGWERQEEAAKKVMKGKRVHCHHLKSWHSLFPACCQIGKDAGPQYVNCITCKYIDGYIEQYDPDKEYEKVDIASTETNE